MELQSVRKNDCAWVASTLRLPSRDAYSQPSLCSAESTPISIIRARVNREGLGSEARISNFVFALSENVQATNTNETGLTYSKISSTTTRYKSVRCQVLFSKA